MPKRYFRFIVLFLNRLNDRVVVSTLFCNGRQATGGELQEMPAGTLGDGLPIVIGANLPRHFLLAQCTVHAHVSSHRTATSSSPS